MKIVLLCATQRGLRFLETLAALAARDDITVFSFRETGTEPRYFDEIQTAARSHGARFIEATAVQDPAVRDVWQEPVDLLLAVSWRYLVPRAVFEIPTLGSFVFHDSLLPEHRGFSPTVWAIANGEDHTGVTLFEMSDEVDAGDIIDQQQVPIGADETIRDVLAPTTEAYVALLRRNLDVLKSGAAPRHPQDHAAATYCRRRTIEDNRILWDRRPNEIHNLVRAVTDPYPGAFTTLGGRLLTVWAAEPTTRSSGDGRAAGSVVRIHKGTGVEVAAGGGSLLITRVQLDGDRPMTADRVVGNQRIVLGT